MPKRQNTYVNSSDVAPRTREILQNEKWYGDGSPRWLTGKDERPAQTAEEAYENRRKLIKRLRKHLQTFPEAEALIARLESCDDGYRCHGAACSECARAYTRWFVQAGRKLLKTLATEMSVLSLVHDQLRVPLGELTPERIQTAKRKIQTILTKAGVTTFVGGIDISANEDGTGRVEPYYQIQTWKRSAGETSRFVDMPGTRKGSLGLIDYVPAQLNGSPEELKKWAVDQITALKKACERHHGHALPTFIEHVIANRKTIRGRIEDLMDQFRRTAKIAHAAGADKRRADLFALIYAAAQLAVEWGIVPWTAKQVGRAIRRCYWDTCQPQSNQLLEEGLQIVRDRLGGSSIIDLRQHKPGSRQEMEEADGVLRVWRNGPLVACIKSDRFREWFKSSAQQQLVVARLSETKALDGNEKRGLPTRQCRLPLLSEKLSCFVIRIDAFEKLVAGTI
jgi:hypothetical protein